MFLISKKHFDNFEIKGLSENLSNSEIQQNNSTVFPNPVSDYLNIRSENEILKIQIYDLLGKNLIRTEQDNLASVNLSLLSPGVYIVKIFSDEIVESKRIIKK